MPPFKDRTGQRFGKLLVIERADNFTYKGGGRQVGYLCQCDCGNLCRKNQSAFSGKTPTGSCGCIQKAILQARALEPYRAIYNRFLRVQAWLGNEVTITYEQFVTFTKEQYCHYCGIELYWAIKRQDTKPGGYNLDRKDPSCRLYSADGCVPCCPRCNRSKSNTFSYEEWVEVGKAIRAFRERK